MKKINISELVFQSDHKLPEVPASDPVPWLGLLFPSRMMSSMAKGGGSPSGGRGRDAPLKISKIAELPVDPQFAEQVELVTKKPADSNMEDDLGTEYVPRVDSRGKKINLRRVHCRFANTSEPSLTTLLTSNELKVRARSLAYAQFKKEKREKNRRILIGQLAALQSTVMAIVFYNKLKHAARTKHNSRAEERAKPGGKKPSSQVLTTGKKFKDTSSDGDLSAKQRGYASENSIGETMRDATARDHRLDTISEISAHDNNVSQQLSVDTRLEGATVTLGNFDSFYLDIDGLKKFLDTLDKCKGLNRSLQSAGSKRRPRKKEKRLQDLLMQSEYISKRKERLLQQEALRKAFDIDI